MGSASLADRPPIWNPLIPLDDPYPVYRRLRDEVPLYHAADADVWALTRYADVLAASQDWETFSSGAGGTGNDVDDTYQLFLPAGDMAGSPLVVASRIMF